MNVLPRSVPLARWVFRASAFVAATTVVGVWWLLPSGPLFPVRLQETWSRDAVMGGFQVAVVVAALLMGHAARRTRTMPVAELNVPYAGFWLPSREACARRRLEDDVWWLGTWVMWLLAWAACAVHHAHTRGASSPEPALEWTILAVMGSVLALGAIVRRGFYGRFARAALAEPRDV